MHKNLLQVMEKLSFKRWKLCINKELLVPLRHLLSNYYIVIAFFWWKMQSLTASALSFFCSNQFDFAVIVFVEGLTISLPGKGRSAVPNLKHWNSARNITNFSKKAPWQFPNLPKDKKKFKEKILVLHWFQFFWQFTIGRANLPFSGHLCNSGTLVRIGLSVPWIWGRLNRHNLIVLKRPNLPDFRSYLLAHFGTDSHPS